MAGTVDDAWQRLMELVREAAVLNSCGAVLSWDRETGMPAGGIGHRAEQLQLLAGLVHDRQTSPELGELLATLEDAVPADDDSDDRAVTVRELRRAWDRATRLPRRLVQALSHTTALAQQHWTEARSTSDYNQFAPWLSRLLELKREEADAVGWSEGGEPYDALLDEYEPDVTSAELSELFGQLRGELVPLIAAISDSGRRAPVEILQRQYPELQQRQLARDTAAAIGFDFECGRLDVAVHPFCMDCGAGDVRLTTRYDEHFFSSAFFGTLHEAGHGLYEQGLPREHIGTPPGSARSLGIHESQSRLWENLVGRSDAFWQHVFPDVQSRFPESLSEVTRDEFLFAVNHVAPSFIRVEADEVTYNLHIMLRFDLERDLINGHLSVDDLPGAWNDRFLADFGIRPPDNARGCLQDIHWSAGLFGYFPTYTLGNICASQLFAACGRELGDLPDQLSRGEFAPLLSWLRDHIHRHGQRYRTPELLRRATGDTLNQQPLLDHLRQRFGRHYDLPAS